MTILVLHGITQVESDKRRKQIERSIRLNQSEGLQPTARLLELTDKYISGEIEFKEWSRTIRSWRTTAAA
jgi:hypothetical protein